MDAAHAVRTTGSVTADTPECLTPRLYLTEIYNYISSECIIHAREIVFRRIAALLAQSSAIMVAFMRLDDQNALGCAYSEGFGIDRKPTPQLREPA